MAAIWQYEQRSAQLAKLTPEYPSVGGGGRGERKAEKGVGKGRRERERGRQMGGKGR